MVSLTLYCFIPGETGSWEFPRTSVDVVVMKRIPFKNRNLVIKPIAIACMD
jgi:hypothetical protein